MYVPQCPEHRAWEMAVTGSTRTLPMLVGHSPGCIVSKSMSLALQKSREFSFHKPILLYPIYYIVLFSCNKRHWKISIDLKREKT